MFLQFNSIKLNVTTSDGQNASAFLRFYPGCNLITTNDNSRGKSTIINSLAVGLGFDDLVKGNILGLIKDELKVNNQTKHIKSSNIQLELQNQAGEKLNLIRSVYPDLSNGMLVKSSPDSPHSEYEEFYLKKDSYTGDRGFYKKLCQFINFPELEVPSRGEAPVRLYLEYIFSAIFIEQTRGWTDIMANAPFFHVLDPKRTTLSKILGLSYVEQDLVRSSLKFDAHTLKTEYEATRTALKELMREKNLSIHGIPSDPRILIGKPFIFQGVSSGNDLPLQDILSLKKGQLKQITSTTAPQSSDEQEITIKLSRLSNNLGELSERKKDITSNLERTESAIEKYKHRMIDLEKDLQTNKEERRIQNIFGPATQELHSTCPTCRQSINGTLLAQDSSLTVMSIEENISYLSEQIKLLGKVIRNEEEKRDIFYLEAQELRKKEDTTLRDIINLQKSLNGTIPADLMSKARDIAVLEQDIERYSDLNNYAQKAFKELQATQEKFINASENLNKLQKVGSEKDDKIINDFESQFQSYLGKLGYNSYEVKSIFIDKTTLLPRVQTRTKRVRADLGSSASDWVRIIMAYTLALQSGSDGLHPKVSIMDEPAQHSMTDDDHLTLYSLALEVCAKSKGQIIIAATDRNGMLRQKAHELDINLIDFQDSYVLS